MKRTQRVRNVKEEDAEQITKIFNSYIGTGFAAFSEQSIPTEIFFFQVTVSTGFPCVVVVCDSGEGGKEEEIVGFGISRQHHSGSSAFKRVAEVSYFVKEKETHKGIGTMILKELERRLHEEHEIIQILEVASVHVQVKELVFQFQLHCSFCCRFFCVFFVFFFSNDFFNRKH